ncbi:uncharacterized protein LOC143045502 [Mytilus galloprovincialis]|uniref:uncharacterized protein LOC143045502 n=1 Tax=Mytilus galloprovincialis TaxID=29158 RepID=UPI003F7C2A6E
MDLTVIKNGNEENGSEKNQAEKIVVTNTFGKRRNSTSPSLTDEPVIKKIKTYCDEPENEEEDEPKNEEKDEPENEEENDDENIPQPMKKRKEAEDFPKLYRLLHENEDITKGLTAKSPGAEKDVATHVATGSKKGRSSQYISTCASLYKAESFRNLKLKSGYKWGMKHIAEIDVGSLPDDVEIIDLRTSMFRRKYEIADNEINENFHKFADSHQEVLLMGTVPAACLKLLKFTGVVPDSDNSCSDSDDCGFDYDSYNSNPDSDSDWY